MQRRGRELTTFFSLLILSWCTFGIPIPGAAEAIVEKKPPVFHYSPQGKIDPFKPLVRKETAKKKVSVSQSPLQYYSLEQLKLIGIMAGGKKRVAIISDPRGKSYVISTGTLIGSNNGRVAGILEDQVIVEERMGEDNRKVKTRRIILNLHRAEVEGKL